MTATELKYVVIENEFMVVLYVVNKFFHYVTGYQVTIHTDHYVIKYLMKKPITNGRVTRWLPLLQEFDISIMDKPSKHNLVANFISRIISAHESLLIGDAFLDEHLFVISTNVPWFADVANYLVARKFPGHMPSKEK